MKRKIESYLGFAKKSGKLVSGTHTCTVNGDRGKLKLLIIAEDTAPGSRKKMVQLAQRTRTPYKIYGLGDELSHIVGESRRSVFGITDKNFAEIIQKAIRTEEKSEKEVL